MPELPEVETVAKQLSTKLIGKHIREVWINDPKLSELPKLPFMNSQVKNVRRLGKQVVVEFSKNGQSGKSFFLIVHLRMTGRLIWYSSNSETGSAERIPNMNYVNEKSENTKTKPPRAIIIFDDGQLDFLDTRRFGTFDFSTDLSRFQPQGIDPLTRDYSLSALKDMLSRTQQTMKQFLLRQDRLVGLGNIYACEILFRSHIHPERKANSLKSGEVQKIFEVIPEVLKQAIDHCGTTFSDFQHTNGDEGGFQNFLTVYQKEGVPCQTCKQVIERISQQGRSTFFCPRCQV